MKLVDKRNEQAGIQSNSHALTLAYKINGDHFDQAKYQGQKLGLYCRTTSEDRSAGKLFSTFAEMIFFSICGTPSIHFSLLGLFLLMISRTSTFFPVPISLLHMNRSWCTPLVRVLPGMCSRHSPRRSSPPVCRIWLLLTSLISIDVLSETAVPQW